MSSAVAEHMSSFFAAHHHSSLAGAERAGTPHHRAAARYYHQQMHSPYGASAASHGVVAFRPQAKLRRASKKKDGFLWNKFMSSET
ncbi:Uncharacterized protein GBIM_03817 [Gryllus bimaculatus]|nr:Uncharacterized protein GBIM_03817 [Gryllus bimaculatus]